MTALEEVFVGRQILALREAQGEAEQTHQTTSSEEAAGSNERNLLDQIPEDEMERKKFVDENFSDFSSDKIDLFKVFLQKEMRDWAKVIPEGATYPDSVATIVGVSRATALTFLSTLIFIRDGENNLVSTLTRQELDEIVGMRFSVMCEDYLNVNVCEVFPGFDEKIK